MSTDRPHGLGGSDAAAALGLSPYKSQVRLWLEKTGRVEPDEPGESAKWVGVLEPLLAAELRNYGYSVVSGATLQDDWRYGHTDGTAYTDSSEGIAELKTCSIRLASQWDDEQIPISYQAQGAHYLSLCKAQFVVFGCLIAGQRFVVRRMKRDDKVIASLVEAEKRFWEHVVTDTQPPVTGATSADLAWLYPESNGTVISLDNETLIVENLTRARAARKAAEEAEQEAENVVKARLGDAEQATVNGRKVVTWKSHTATRLDSARLKEERPDIHSEFVTEKTVRPLRLY